MVDLNLVYVGLFGGLAINLVGLMELRARPKNQRPELTDPLYWATFAIAAVLGAGLVWIYLLSDMTLTAILAFNVGASAPVIIKAAAKATKSPVETPPAA